jgi:amino acid permease
LANRLIQYRVKQAGAAIGTAIGIGMILGLWCIVIVGALVFGLFLKKSSLVEKGPTGVLAMTPRQPEQPH